MALGSVDGDDNIVFVAKLKVPADAAPGEALVRATSRSSGLAEPLPPAEVRFLVLGREAGR